MWTGSSRILAGELDTHGNDRDIKNFYWEDMKKDSIKAKSYDNNNFEKTSEYLKLCYEYPEYSYGLYWLFIVAKAANIVKDTCLDTCPCCNSGNQTFEHWFFNYHCSQYLCLIDNSFNNINLNTNVNLLNDNSNYNRNSNVENRTENNINNPSTNSVTDHDNSRNLENSNRINSDNYVDNDINNECNNTRDLVNVMNSDSNENNNRNLDFNNNFIIMARGYIIMFFYFNILKYSNILKHSNMLKHKSHNTLLL